MKWLKISRTKWTWRFYVLSTPWFGIKMHWIRPEEDEWHDHPWNGFSLILGSYEEMLYPYPSWHRVWFFNKIGAFTPHRTRGNTLTLFFHGPRVNEDWFWGEDKAPWRGVQNDK